MAKSSYRPAESSLVTADRRQFLSAAGLGLLAFQLGGVETFLSPREAKAQAVPLRTLSPQQVLLVDALGDTLVPGAATLGLTHYLDQQLTASPGDSLLMIRYLDVPPPYYDFYQPALAAIESASRAMHNKDFHQLAASERDAFVGALQKGDLKDWQGPPAPLVYFVLRADAIDVVYGTPEGFAKLGVPYMPHIMPPSNW